MTRFFTSFSYLPKFYFYSLYFIVYIIKIFPSSFPALLFLFNPYYIIAYILHPYLLSDKPS